MFHHSTLIYLSIYIFIAHRIISAGSPSSDFISTEGKPRNKPTFKLNVNCSRKTKKDFLQKPVTSYTLFISGIANRNWHFYQSKERLAKLFKERLLIAYRRPKSLRDMLVSSKLRSKTTKDEANTEHGCGPCNKPRCSWCLLIEKNTTFTAGHQSG